MKAGNPAECGSGGGTVRRSVELERAGPRDVCRVRPALAWNWYLTPVLKHRSDSSCKCCNELIQGRNPLSFIPPFILHPMPRFQKGVLSSGPEQAAAALCPANCPDSSPL